MNKHIKPLISLGMLLLSLLLLNGCRASAPEQAVKAELDLIQQLDENTIQAFVSYEDMMHSQSSGSSIGAETTEAVQLFFENFRYRILSSSATERTATVNVEITNLDTKALAKDLCRELIKQSIEPEGRKTPLNSMNSYFALLRDIITANDYETVTTHAHFELIHANDIWTIQSTEKLEDELVGGFISCLNDPYLITPEESLTLAFDMLREQTAKEWVEYLQMNDIFSTYSTVAADVDLALAAQIMSHFNYEIKKVTEENDRASATVAITSLDLDHVLDEYLKKLMSYTATTEAVRDSEAGGNVLADKTAELLIQVLHANEKNITKNINVEFINNGSTWEMQLSDDFTDIILGNMNSAVEAFQVKAAEVRLN